MLLRQTLLTAIATLNESDGCLLATVKHNLKREQDVAWSSASDSIMRNEGLMLRCQCAISKIKIPLLDVNPIQGSWVDLSNMVFLTN
jgi:hypothetical protein